MKTALRPPLTPIKMKFLQSFDTQHKGTQSNPLKILEPGRKRLTSLKAERIIRVSEESIKNVQIVLTLSQVTASVFESQRKEEAKLIKFQNH